MLRAMGDDYFRTVPVPLPHRGGLHRSRRLLLELIPDWTMLQDPTGRVLPPQEWPGIVELAMGPAMIEAEGWIEDEDERARLVLRMLAASSATADGDVLARAFQVNEFAVIGLTITIDEPAEQPSWVDPRSPGPTLDEIATTHSAEPAVLSSPTLPRYLRLARDLRSGDVSWALLTAIAAEDRPREVKSAETDARAARLLEQARNPALVEEDPPEKVSAEVWLRYEVPVPHSPLLVTLTFCGYGDAGFDNPLGEANRRVAVLEFGKG